MQRAEGGVCLGAEEEGCLTAEEEGCLMAEEEGCLVAAEEGCPMASSAEEEEELLPWHQAVAGGCWPRCL